MKNLNKSGISLLLVLLILGVMLTAVLIVSDIMLRQTRVMRKITDSERAYFAVETGAEETLYEINKVKQKNIVTELSGCWCAANCNNCQINYSGNIAQWSVNSVAETQKVPVTALNLCAIPEFCANNPTEPISTSNRLKVKLQNNQSFQLSFDMKGSTYVGSIVRISWPSTKSSRVVVAIGNLGGAVDDQREYDETDVAIEEIKIPDPEIGGNMLANKFYKLRIINTSGEEVTYEIWPTAGSFMPIGAAITISANYKGTERKIENNNSKWHFYGQ